MAVRPIDGDALKNQIRHMPRTINPDLVQYSLVQAIIADMPTLTPPNEQLTLIDMSDELPPDNERVLVYMPCMEDTDICPYSVQWGLVAKKDGSHWAHLPGRRPPEDAR